MMSLFEGGVAIVGWTDKTRSSQQGQLKLVLGPLPGVSSGGGMGEGVREGRKR